MLSKEIKMIKNEKDLLDFFILIVPSFLKEWNDGDNYNIEDDGTYTYCGVCMEFAQFFQDQKSYRNPYCLLDDTYHEDIPKHKMIFLFEVIENILSDKVLQFGDIGGSVRSCFLENIAQTAAGEYAKQFMGEKSREYFDQWHVYP